jgi:selenocysteine-specific elongation factor
MLWRAKTAKTVLSREHDSFLVVLVRRAGGRGLAHVAARGALPAGEARAAIGATAAARLVELGGWLAAPDRVEHWSQAAADTLAAYHRQHPLDRAAPKDVVARAVAGAGCPPAVLSPALDWLAERGDVVAEGPGLRLPDHRVQLDPAHTTARQELLATLERDPFAPPRLTEAAEAAGATPALVRELEAAGEIVRLSADLALTADALDEAVSRLRDAYASEGPLTAARAKEVLGTTRKYALPLLEELDRRGVTRRLGDVRELRN